MYCLSCYVDVIFEILQAVKSNKEINENFVKEKLMKIL